MVKYFEKDGVMYQTYVTKDNKRKVRRYISNQQYNKRENEREIYKEWRYMIKRCNNKNQHCSKYYHDKGIKVCDEWKDSETGFDNFYEWAINNGYKEELSLDRINSDEGYNPSNCRWLTLEENRKLGLSQPHIPKWEYKAYNKEENVLLIFHKASEFTDYCGLDSRRVSDGCKKSNYTYKGWKFTRRAINLDYYGSQETIPTGSTLEDELPMEVRIIRLSTNADKDIVRST